MKKIKLLVVALIAVILLPFTVNAKDNDKINVYIFKGDGCGYCKAAIEFFDSIEKDYGKYFELVEYEVWYSEENATLMTNVASYFGEEVGGVPYIVIGDKTFQGYAESYNEEIKKAIKDAYNNKDYVDAVASVNKGDTKASKDTKEEDNGNKTTIIIIGVALVGFVALFYFARDTEVEEVKEVKKETKVVEEPKKEEVKKTESKKTTTTKKAPAKKATSSKKTTTTKSSASKKTTTAKKAPAKKTTTKKTTKK